MGDAYGSLWETCLQWGDVHYIHNFMTKAGTGHEIDTLFEI